MRSKKSEMGFVTAKLGIKGATEGRVRNRVAVIYREPIQKSYLESISLLRAEYLLRDKTANENLVLGKTIYDYINRGSFFFKFSHQGINGDGERSYQTLTVKEIVIIVMYVNF